MKWNVFCSARPAKPCRVTADCPCTPLQVFLYWGLFSWDSPMSICTLKTAMNCFVPHEWYPIIFIFLQLFSYNMRFLRFSDDTCSSNFFTLLDMYYFNEKTCSDVFVHFLVGVSGWSLFVLYSVFYACESEYVSKSWILCRSLLLFSPRKTVDKVSAKVL